MINLLLQNGADPNDKDNQGKTPLHYACLFLKNRSLLEALLSIKKKNKALHIQDNEGNTPLHVACEYGNLGFAKLLLESKANPNVQNKKGDTPLHIASLSSAVDSVKLLLEHGADPRITNNKGKQPSQPPYSRFFPVDELLEVSREQWDKADRTTCLLL